MRVRFKVASTFGALILLCLLKLDALRSLSSYGTQRETVHDVFNETLGFQQIFAIGLPDRTDKRDTLTLAASLTGINLSWIEGVRPNEISEKAVPPTWNFENQKVSVLACWRAHMNVIERIVREKIQTALVLEDDVDWDVTIKRQLAQFAIATRALQRTTGFYDSPFGHNWDFLWLGHHYIRPVDEMTDLFVLLNDITVPPTSRRHAFWKLDRIPPDLHRNDTRIVFRAGSGMGTMALAISLKGARKILSTLSLHAPSAPIDVMYNRMCWGRYQPQLNCYAPYPTLFAPHRAAGPTSRDSDINNRSSRWHDEFSYDMVYSTILNIPQMVAGNRSVQAQWPEAVKHPVIDLTQVPIAQGHLHQIDLQQLPTHYINGVNHQMKPKP